MKYYNFRRGAKEVNPVFKAGEETASNIKWELKWVYYNWEKEATKKDWTPFTVPENVNLKIGEDSLSFSIQDGKYFRQVLSTLVNDNIKLWTQIELNTYTDKAGFKKLTIKNPLEQKEITYMKDGKETSFTTAEEFPAIYIDEQMKENFEAKIKEHKGNKDKKSAVDFMQGVIDWAKGFIPKAEVFLNKKWEFISMDDSEANEYIINIFKEKVWGDSTTNVNVEPSKSSEEISVEDIPF